MRSTTTAPTIPHELAAPGTASVPGQWLFGIPSDLERRPIEVPDECVKADVDQITVNIRYC